MVYPVITLFSPTEIDFTTNGLGSLAEAESCTVTEEANGEFELEMVYPMHGRRFNDISIRSIIFAKPNPIDPPQAFRIYQIEKPINGLVTIYAAHISYDLSGYPVTAFTANGVLAAFGALKTKSVRSHPFTFWTDKQTTGTINIKTPTSIRSVLGGIEGSILDVYRGEYKFNNFEVRLYNNRGMDRGVSIRYGKNLTDVKQQEDGSSVYTAILPYWTGTEGDGEDEHDVTVQLPELYLPTEGEHNFTNILTVDLSSEFQEQPTVEELRRVAQAYINERELGTPKVSFDVSFAQLDQTEEYKDLAPFERVELFDTVEVEYPEMKISSKAKVNKTVYDVIAGRYKSVSIGTVRANISDTIGNTDEVVKEELQDIPTFLEQSIKRATNWITNGKGYMVAIKDAKGNWYEQVSLDTPDINTAVNVWRWNNGGFGHSSHGYDGPYETAITQDGHINANFMDTGVLTANIIRAGRLEDLKNRNYWDLVTGDFKITASSSNINILNADGTTATLSQFFNTSFEVSASGIKSDVSSLSTTVNGPDGLVKKVEANSSKITQTATEINVTISSFKTEVSNSFTSVNGSIGSINESIKTVNSTLATKLTASEFGATLKQDTTFKDLSGKVTNQETAIAGIQGTVDGINSSLSLYVKYADKASVLRQLSDQIVIAFSDKDNDNAYSTINKQGYFLYNSSSTKKDEAALYASFTGDGNRYYTGSSGSSYSSPLIGRIGAGALEYDKTKNGLNFNLAKDGSYMGWGSTSDTGIEISSYTFSLMYSRNANSTDDNSSPFRLKTFATPVDKSLNAFTSIDMHQHAVMNMRPIFTWGNCKVTTKNPYGLYPLSEPIGGITVKIPFCQVTSVDKTDGTIAEYTNATLTFTNGILTDCYVSYDPKDQPSYVTHDPPRTLTFSGGSDRYYAWDNIPNTSY